MGSDAENFLICLLAIWLPSLKSPFKSSVHFLLGGQKFSYWFVEVIYIFLGMNALLKFCIANNFLPSRAFKIFFLFSK